MLDTIIDGLVQYVQLLWSQIVNVPTDNPLSILYAVLNVVLQVFALFGA